MRIAVISDIHGNWHAFEAVLAKTLEAVGRGRQKLHGRIATDDLGALADDTTTFQHSSDADYLADLAALADSDRTPERRPPNWPGCFIRRPPHQSRSPIRGSASM